MKFGAGLQAWLREGSSNSPVVCEESTTEINMDGAYSWDICAVCCIANAATCGFYNSYGTLFVAIIQEYQVSETVAGEEILVIFIFMNNR